MAKLKRAPLEDLRPTQLTVGMLEVHEKKKHLAALAPKDLEDFLQAHPMPTVIGPHGALYITDHHHLARAALEVRVATGYLTIEDDLSELGMKAFWEHMDEQLWVHPLDQNGIRHQYESLPRHLGDLVDDVYRSLAGYVRDAGGYDKTRTAFAEFIWADFFRRTVPIEDLSADFHEAVRRAKFLARSPLAKGIPGFKG